MNDLIPIPNQNLLPPDRNPALVYLASLAPTGRRTTAGRRTMIARDIMGIPDPESVPWHQLRYQHVAAIRTKLQERGYKPRHHQRRTLCHQGSGESGIQSRTHGR